jgi:hypothetical protein
MLIPQSSPEFKVLAYAGLTAQTYWRAPPFAARALISIFIMALSWVPVTDFYAAALPEIVSGLQHSAHLPGRCPSRIAQLAHARWQLG